MKHLLPLAALLALVPGPTPAADPATPPGFTPLFNGRDLAGWHGWDIHKKGAAPADFDKLSADEKEKAITAWTTDAKKHWSVENGELVNDGHGAYLTVFPGKSKQSFTNDKYTFVFEDLKIPG